MSIFVFSVYCNGAELYVEKDGSTLKFKTIEQDKKEYIGLSVFLAPLPIQPVYNRALHKISFTFSKNVFSLSPVSNAIAVNGAVQLFETPVIVKKGVVYVSKEVAVFLSPYLSYSIVKKLIVIDPGHGGTGDDGLGAKGKLNGNNVYEKQVTLKFAKSFGLALEKLGYQVSYTRTQDKKIPLSERTKSANADGAKVFISIHANSSNDSLVKGADVFYMSEEAEDSYSETVAKQENLLLSEQKAEKDVHDILKSMMVSGHIKESARLAYDMSVSLSSDVISRGVKKAPFAVLHNAYMPSVLVELGFITNESDISKITNDVWVKNTAYNLANGVDTYFRESKEE